jgi:hypothetical protein
MPLFAGPALSLGPENVLILLSQKATVSGIFESIMEANPIAA